MITGIGIGLGWVVWQKQIIGERKDYTFRIGNQRYGIRDVVSAVDGIYSELPMEEGTATQICLGPIGSFWVPFSATVGLVGFCCILATLIIVPVVLTVRWKKRVK
jgi:hypothetical protein